MIAALVTTGAHFDPGGQPVSTADLFDYDVSRGGQRFLINTGVKHAEGAPMSVVLNGRKAQQITLAIGTRLRPITEPNRSTTSFRHVNTEILTQLITRGAFERLGAI